MDSGEAVIEGQIESLNEAGVARLPAAVFNAFRREPDFGQGRGAIGAGQSVLDDVVKAAEVLLYAVAPGLRARCCGLLTVDQHGACLAQVLPLGDGVLVARHVSEFAGNDDVG